LAGLALARTRGQACLRCVREVVHAASFDSMQVRLQLLFLFLLGPAGRIEVSVHRLVGPSTLRSDIHRAYRSPRGKHSPSPFNVLPRSSCACLRGAVPLNSCFVGGDRPHLRRVAAADAQDRTISSSTASVGAHYITAAAGDRPVAGQVTVRVVGVHLVLVAEDGKP
jgi:hypothetical protein